jgi:hypothetical protein
MKVPCKDRAKMADLQTKAFFQSVINLYFEEMCYFCAGQKQEKGKDE